MEVVLVKDVNKLGKIGDVVKVKDGFARNFLIPQKAAFLATPANLKKIEQERLKKAAADSKIKKEAEGLAVKLSKASFNISVEVNDLEKLYGSVSEADIARILETEGYTMDKKNVLFEKPIDELGIYEVGVKLHPEVIAKIRLWVTKK